MPSASPNCPPNPWRRCSSPSAPECQFKLRLPASPSHSDRYSPWHLADGIVLAKGSPSESHDAFAIRYRVL
jgi:hypothetical protein